MAGDVNENGELGIGDIADIIDYLFITGTALCTVDASDVNGDCSVSIGDVALLIDHLYINGAPLRCACSNGMAASAMKVRPDIEVSSEWDGRRRPSV